jgi:hypothetical protein
MAAAIIMTMPKMHGIKSRFKICHLKHYIFSVDASTKVRKTSINLTAFLLHLACERTKDEGNAAAVTTSERANGEAAPVFLSSPGFAPFRVLVFVSRLRSGVATGAH